MNIVLVGGRRKADYILDSLLSKKHTVVVIHDELNFCKMISRTYDVSVICGDGSNPQILEESKIEGFDLLIALTPQDADNLVICQLAKNNYNVKKTFAIVSNPKNVEIFKMLGIDNVISSTHVVAGIIEQMAVVEDMRNFISLGQGQIGVMEIEISNAHKICNKQIQKLDFPDKAIIACIIRGGASIIPKGKTQVQAGDRLVILSPSDHQNDVINSVVGKN